MRATLRLVGAAMVLATGIGLEARVAAVHAAPAAMRPQPAASLSPPPAAPAPPPPPSPAATPLSPPAGRVLAVPLLAQTWNLSCEAASLQMALAYEGIRVAQSSLLAAMRPDYSRPVQSGGRVVSWTDPYDHFVGDPAGHEYDHSGYGVYYPVVARVAEEFGARVAWAGTGLGWDQLRLLVLSGHPVVLWAAYDGATYGPDGPVYRYRATDGREVVYAPGFEHAVTVSGVGDGGVLLDNPRWGHRDRLSPAGLLAATAPFGGMAVALG